MWSFLATKWPGLPVFAYFPNINDGNTLLGVFASANLLEFQLLFTAKS